MVGEGSSSGGKRLAFHDLDASNWDNVVATPMEIPKSSNMQSAPSSTLEGKKKKQKASAYEKNPQYPPNKYGHFVREKVCRVLQHKNCTCVGANIHRSRSRWTYEPPSGVEWCNHKSP
jgi:hypothetical protein